MMKKRVLSIAFILLIALSAVAQSKYTLSGYVKEKGSGELLPGVTVYVPSLKTGISTNSYGFYSLTLPKAKYEIKFSFIGFETQSLEIELTEDTVRNVFITSSALALDEVVVTADRMEMESETSQMSVIKLPVESVADIPAFLGEKDVLKVLQLMPGVQSGSEGHAGMYVRGGGPDQNLLILDDATVYNASHLLGFFSVFNGDAIKSTEMYKGGFPARFGGRLSSVIKMDMKDGNKEKIHGKIGVGILSSSFTLEGPLKKGKTSFLVSGRRTYFDLLTRPFQPKNTKGGYYFYDLNVKINHEFSDRDKLYVSGFFGRDVLSLDLKDQENSSNNVKGRQGWGNITTTTRWNHQFGKKWFSNASFVFSNFDFSVDVENINEKRSYVSRIRDYSLKYDVDYFPTPNHSVKLGVISTIHEFSPAALVVKRETEPIDTSSPFSTLESAVYLEDDMKLFGRVNINAGIRLSHFIHKKVDYLNPEPRVSIGYQLWPGMSVKTSYSSMNQYIHLLSSSSINLPTDLWVSSTDRVKPQRSQQVAIGMAKDFPEQRLTLTIEGYYKKSRDVIAYGEGQGEDFLEAPNSSENTSWEDKVTSGKSWSRGIEVLLQKKSGKFTGWLGYTLAKVEMQFDALNLGRKFLARYDRTHDISLVGIYKPSDEITLSATWVYGTGNNYSLPVAKYRSVRIIDNHRVGIQNSRHKATIDDYGENLYSFRAEPYHRLDIGVQFHKKKKRGMRTWEIGIYNVYSRLNPFFYQMKYVQDGDNIRPVLKRVSIFPIIPSFKYTFEF